MNQTPTILSLQYNDGAWPHFIFHKVNMGNIYFCSDVNISCSRVDTGI